MQKNACTFLLSMLFGFLVFSQPVQIISNIDISEVGELTITSVSHVSDVSAAHITTPSSLPQNNSIKADANHPLIWQGMNWIIPITYYFEVLLSQTESDGFIDIRKYKSNYLP